MNHNNNWRVPLLLLSAIVIISALGSLPQHRFSEFLKVKGTTLIADLISKDSIPSQKPDYDDDQTGHTSIPECDIEGTDSILATIFRDYQPEHDPSVVAIEEFVPIYHSEMDKFYAALDSASRRPVRILYYGDSFIEGDLLTQNVRESLQQQYGGCGVGFVDITSLTSQFRRTISTTESGWNSYGAHERNRFKAELQGINGKYFTTDQSAMVEFRCTHNIFPAHLGSVPCARFFFAPGQNCTVTASINGDEPQPVYSGHAAADTILSVTLRDSISRIAFRVNAQPDSRFFGVALEDTVGICVDNMSVRGSNGTFLSRIPTKTLRQFAACRQYDLIVVQFGLNVASNAQKSYTGYLNKMRDCIHNFREAYPSAAILLVGVSDRDERNASGDVVTMEGIKNLLHQQHAFAHEESIAFWDMRQAMGGEASIKTFCDHGWARHDYTHITSDGGAYIAGKFVQALLAGKRDYDRRRQLIRKYNHHQD